MWDCKGEGATKGALYGALFMLILGAAALLWRSAMFRQGLTAAPVLAGALLGPLLSMVVLEGLPR